MAADAVSISQVAGQAAPAAGQAQQPGAQVSPLQVAAGGITTAAADATPGVPAASAPGQEVKAADKPGLPGAPAQAQTAIADAGPSAAHPTPGTQHPAPGNGHPTPAAQHPIPDPKPHAPVAPAQPKAPTPAGTAPNQNPTQQSAGQQQPPPQQDTAGAALTDTTHPTPATPANAAPAAPPPAAPTVAPAQPAPQAGAPAPAPTQAPAAPPPGMRLQQAVETVHEVIRISQSSGITQVRVQLHPAELGSVDIHMRSTPDGVVARVVADASQAAAVLRDGGDELRRQLASQGINLTHFDVGTTGHEHREAGFGDGGSHQRGGHGNKSENADRGSSPDHTEETTITLPNGVLVDVLA